MTSDVKIRNLEVADDTDLRKQEVKIGETWIETPIKTITPDILYADRTFPKQNGLIELFRQFKPSNMEAFLNNPRMELALNNSMNNLKNRGGASNPAIVMMQYYSERYPNEDEINRLCRISHVFSDITPIPSIPKLTRGDNLTPQSTGSFFDYINKALDSIKQRNKKPIMGYLPIVTNTIILEDLIDRYFEEGLNSFYMDFDGTQIVSYLTKIDAIKNRIAQYGYEEKHFLYFVNARYSTNAIGGSNVVPAKDVIGFAWGLDGFGGSHMAPRRSRKYYEWLASKKNIDENRIRIFDKDAYGYHKVVNPNNDSVKNIFPRDSIIPFADFDFSKASAVERMIDVVNLQQQMVESKKVITKIKENPQRTYDYYESKRFLDRGTLKKIKK